MSTLLGSTQVIDSSFSPVYKRVMAWVAGQMAVSALTAIIVGPLIPPAMIAGINLAIVVGLLIMSFVRVSPRIAPIIALIIPAAMGLILYTTVNYYISAGMGDIVLTSIGATTAVFTVMAVLGWKSERSIEGWSGKMFAILIGLIVLGLLNSFLHMTMLSLVISGVAVILFSAYIFLDIQRIRDLRQNDNATASVYALSIFMDVVNLFMNILNILGIVSRR